MDYQKIGNFIQQKRKEKELTQKELAKELHLTDKAVSKWERGLGCPDVSTLEHLADLLDVNILSLLNGEEVEEHDSKSAVIKTLNYSKDYQKKKEKMLISNLVLMFVFALFSFLVVSNIVHIIYLEQNNEITISRDSLDSVHETLPKIEANIEAIKNSDLVYTETEKSDILKSLNEAYVYVKNSELLDITTTKTYNFKELYEMFNKRSILSKLSVIRKVNEYDESDRLNYDSHINKTLLSMLALDKLMFNIRTASKYQSPFIYPEVDSRYADQMVVVVLLKMDAADLYDITNYVLEVGVVNE